MRDAIENRPGIRGRGRFQQRLAERAQSQSEEIHEPQITHNSKKRRWVKYAVLLFLLLLGFLPYPYETGGPFFILPADQKWIYAETDGIIKEVFYNGNEYLPAGTVISKLSSVEEEGDIQTTQASIMEQRAKLEKLLTTPTEEDLELEQKRLDTAWVQLKYSKESRDRLKKLYEAGNISQEIYDQERRKTEVDSMQMQEAKASLAKVKAGPHPQEIEAARSELDRLEEKLRFQQMDLEMTKLVMPMDGHLVTRNLKHKQGQYLHEGDMFAVVENDNSVLVDIKIPESDISDVSIGSATRLKVWAYPDHIFEGKVTEIDRTVTEDSFGSIVIVSAFIPNPDGLLKSGMTGFGKVDGGEKFVIVAFTRMLVRFFLVEMWSWLP